MIVKSLRPSYIVTSWWLCLGLNAIASRPSLADDALYGELSSSERAALADWTAAYWTRVESGGAAKVECGTLPGLLDHPLFQPARGVRATLELLGVASASSCDGMTTLTPAAQDSTLANAFFLAMTQQIIETDIVSNPTGSARHLALLQSSPGAEWTMDGTRLISSRMPSQLIAGDHKEPHLTMLVSPSSLSLIEKLLNTCPAVASSCGGVHYARHLLTGEPLRADRFQATLTSQFRGQDIWFSRVDAEFGMFGSLPLLVAEMEDCFVLLDTASGALDGPFAADSPLDARPLLMAHDDLYIPGSAIRYISSAGCLVKARWHDSPPSGPLTCPSCGPWTPFPANPPGSPPPPPLTYNCRITPPSTLNPTSLNCTCTVLDIATDPDGRTVTVRQVCECNNCAGTGTPPGPPPGRVPATWTPGTPPPAPATPCICRIEYWY